MNTFKFETLKKRVKENLSTLYNRRTIRWDGNGIAVAHLAMLELVESGSIRNARGCLLTSVLYDEFMKEAIPIVDRWDVRDAKSLAALIPNIVPSWVEDGRFTVDLDENCEWVLQKAA